MKIPVPKGKGNPLLAIRNIIKEIFKVQQEFDPTVTIRPWSLTPDISTPEIFSPSTLDSLKTITSLRKYFFNLGNKEGSNNWAQGRFGHTTDATSSLTSGRDSDIDWIFNSFPAKVRVKNKGEWIEHRRILDRDLDRVDELRARRPSSRRSSA